MNHGSSNTPSKPLTTRFLEPGATTEQLIRATAANHLSWFGEGLRHENGVWWKPGLIAFPEMPTSVASAQLDAIVDYHRLQALQQIACWSLTPTRPRDLGARLAARGFDWGWKPHWMALDLAHIHTDFPLPDDLHIAVNDEAEWDVDDLPYYTRSPQKTPLSASDPPQKQRQWRFGAWQKGRIVGQSLLHVTTGRLGVAGIYNVGVVPAARNQGIGRAVSVAACQVARALGCHYAVLNAATHIYERIGFRSLGFGQTWFLQPETLAAPPPTLTQIAYFEAVGRGDRKTLNALHRETPLEDLDAPLASGMTLMALAAQMGKPQAAEWLIAQGATLDIVHAWDLGWKDRVSGLLARSPSLVNRQVGQQGRTPLHEAASRGDALLARLVLAADPDLEIRDRQYNGTPHDWARVIGRPEIRALIEEHARRKSLA